MNSIVITLLKNSKRPEKGSINPFSIVSFFIVFFFIGGIMAYFSYKVINTLNEYDKGFAFVNVLLLFDYFIIFEKSIFDSLSSLYFSKDLNILLRMPIKSKKILRYKFLDMTIAEYPSEVFMLLIPLLIYGITNSLNFDFYIIGTIILLLMPIIPEMIISLFVAISMRFSNKIKSKTKTLYIAIIISILLISFLSFSINNKNIESKEIENEIYNSYLDATTTGDFASSILNMESIIVEFTNSIFFLNPIYNSFMQELTINRFGALGIFILQTIIFYYICEFIISKIYLKGAIGVTINENKISMSKILTIKDYKKRNIKLSYFIKEMKTIIRSPIFLTQCIIMPLLSIAGVIFLFKYFIDFLIKIFIEQNLPIDGMIENIRKLAISHTGIAVFLGIGQILYMVNLISIIAISKDGKVAKLMKYIPLNINTQLKIKMTLGLIINFISQTIMTVVYYSFTNDICMSILLFLGLTILNIISENLKIKLDKKSPKLDWYSEYAMMKQNNNFIYALGYSILIIVLLAIFTFILSI